MKTEKEIREKIAELKKNYHHVLYEGGCADVWTNAPRALLQVEAEQRLWALHWVLGENFFHKYIKPMNH